MAESKSSALEFVGEAQEELKKVTWPDWPQLKNSTFVIVVFVALVALLILGTDFVVRAGLAGFEWLGDAIGG